MKKIGIVILVTAFFFQAVASLNTQMNTAIRHLGRNIKIGIKVSTLSGRTVYSYHSAYDLVPASNMKAYTAESALLFLGPQYEFVTRLFATSTQVKRHTLSGDVYLDYSGDPTLSITDINNLILKLKKMGVKKINGNFYYDRYAYDQVDTAPGWNKSDLQYCFSAPINAAMINRNCMPYVISPGRRHGHRLKARGASMDFSFLNFNNKGVTGLSRSSCPFLRTSIASDNTINVKGCLLVNTRPRYLSNSINTANGFNIAVINSLLGKNDIRLTGKILSKKINKNLTLIAVKNSKPLSQLVKIMLKKSDNIIAETLFKKLGQRYSSQPGSWANASKAVKAIIGRQDKVNIDNSVLIDGSGLSHYNQTSPDELVSMLRAAYYNKATSRYFMAALPIGGIDGTLKYRMRNRFMRGRVSAKTGSLHGVSSLSGYLKTRNQGILVFSIIINEFDGSITPYRRWEDKILTLIAKQH